jgi:F0F1-type ATP synthase assembly protein I
MSRRKKTWAARAAEFSSLALVLPLSTVVGYIIGYYLDKAFGTHWLKVLFLILGTVGGFVSLIRQIMQASGDDNA